MVIETFRPLPPAGNRNVEVTSPADRVSRHLTFLTVASKCPDRPYSPGDWKFCSLMSSSNTNCALEPDRKEYWDYACQARLAKGLPSRASGFVSFPSINSTLSQEDSLPEVGYSMEPRMPLARCRLRHQVDCKFSSKHTFFMLCSPIKGQGKC